MKALPPEKLKALARVFVGAAVDDLMRPHWTFQTRPAKRRRGKVKFYILDCVKEAV